MLKNVLHKIACCILCILLLHPLPAQVDTSFSLPEIEVTAKRIDLTDIGKHTDIIDSHQLATRHYDHLGAMLSQSTPLFVRSYGSGTLATLGIRGGSASHTQLLWNGIPLRNPMLGLVDLALMPSAFIDHASVHYGGHGAAFGSGAVGGLIAVSNEHPSINNLLKVHLGIGSWGRREGSLQLDYGFSRIRFSSRLFTQRAENNYLYRLDDESPDRRQVHHHLNNNGLLQEISFLMDDKQSLTARAWYQYTNRQIPPTSTQNNSKAAQQDEAFRATLQWNLHHQKSNWQLKTAWLDEVIDFQDTLILLYTHNRFQTWLAEGETSLRINHFLNFTGGLYTEIAKGYSVNYLEPLIRNQSAAFASIAATTREWLWRLQGRQEVTDGIFSPLLFDFSSEWSGVQNVVLKASLSRNYRMPTLNDLHWRPGGNTTLEPEQGWTFESGAAFKIIRSHIKFSGSLTGYTRKIDQWIMWTPPIPGVRNYWSPINIAEVNSRGIETRLDWQQQIKQWQLKVRAAADFTWSTFNTDLVEFRIEAGDQLFYVPVENVTSGLSVTYKSVNVYYDHHWFGPSTGINDPIKASNIGSGGISVQFEKLNLKGSVYLHMDNAWDVPYRIIERRPMPGRSLAAGVKFQFD